MQFIVLVLGLFLLQPLWADTLGCHDSPRHLILDQHVLAQGLMLFDGVSFGKVEGKILLLRKRGEEVWKYYDTKDLALRSKNNELYSRQIIASGGIENWQVVLKSATELQQFEGKQYQRRIYADDLHPLIGLVKRHERENFQQLLKQKFTINEPLKLIEVLAVSRKRATLQLMHLSTPLLNLSVISSEITSYGSTTYSYEMVIEGPGCVVFSGLNENEQQQITRLLSPLESFMEQHAVNSDSLYKIFSELITTELPFWETWIKTPGLIIGLQLIVLILIFGIVLFVLLRRYQQRQGAGR